MLYYCLSSLSLTKRQKSFALSARVPSFERDRPPGGPPLVTPQLNGGPARRAVNKCWSSEEAATRTPLHPAALASVPYGIVLVRVRVRGQSQRQEPRCCTASSLCLCEHYTTLLAMDAPDNTLRLFLAMDVAKSRNRTNVARAVAARESLGCGVCDMKASAAIVEPRLLRG